MRLLDWIVIYNIIYVEAFFVILVWTVELLFICIWLGFESMWIVNRMIVSEVR